MNRPFLTALAVAASITTIGSPAPSVAATGPTTVLIGTTSAGDPLQASGQSMSADGRFVVTDNLQADAGHPPGVYLRDREQGTMTLVSVSSSGKAANGYSEGGVLSADDRFVVFDSYATNLAGADANGGTNDIYLR